MKAVAHQFRIRHIYQIGILVFFRQAFHRFFNLTSVLLVLLGYRTEDKRKPGVVFSCLFTQVVAHISDDCFQVLVVFVAVCTVAFSLMPQECVNLVTVL